MFPNFDVPWQLAYGTDWQCPEDGGINRKLVESLKEAFALGYYHIDGAEMYGTEKEIGLAIIESGLPREKFFVTTKVLENIADIPGAIESSLKRLQLDYVDMYVACTSLHMNIRIVASRGSL